MKIGYIILGVIMLAIGYIGYQYTDTILGIVGLTEPNICMQIFSGAKEVASCISQYNISSLAVVIVSCAIAGTSVGAFAGAFIKK